MKNVIKLFLCLVCICSSMSVTAQKFDPFKGSFYKEAATWSIVAEFDLRNKKIEGQAEGTGLCYGIIEIGNARGVNGYDIVGVDSLDGGEPNITVVSWMFPEMGPIRVGLDYDAKNRTITLNDWNGGSHFDNITLKEKVTQPSKPQNNPVSKTQKKTDSKYHYW